MHRARLIPPTLRAAAGLRPTTKIRQAWFTDRYMACSSPKTMNCRPAPCHTPASVIVKSVGNTMLLTNPPGVLMPAEPTGRLRSVRHFDTAIATG
ncbi:hypothetical protein G6F54_014355 [Rhizopus delemar]|nr:hypothetical protein G6F54_014355 [Rhizopus delemar]